MAKGSGKYGAEATMARTMAGADGVVLIVMGGREGHGFAVQGTAAFIHTLPDVLEQVAADIRRDIAAGQAEP